MGKGKRVIYLCSVFIVSFISFTLSFGENPIEVDLNNKTEMGFTQSKNTVRYTLPMIIEYGLKHNPKLLMAKKEIAKNGYEVERARAENMPKLDITGGIMRHRYGTPLTPFVIEPPVGPNTDFPVFRREVWNVGLAFRFPLFMGGRLMTALNIAEINREIAGEKYDMTRQELIFNLSSLYYKIGHLEKLYDAHDASVKQIELLWRNVEHHLTTGNASKLDLLKTEVELAHVKEGRLMIRNSISSAYELLKTMMGLEDNDIGIAIEEAMGTSNFTPPNLEENIRTAFLQRPDYRMVKKKITVAEERLKMAKSLRLPSVFAVGEYGGLSGFDTRPRENSSYGIRVAMPLLDGGSIKAEVGREAVELEKIKEEERELRLNIIKEVRDAQLRIENAIMRIDVTEKAIGAAKENLRIEELKYHVGTGTTQDVLDARTVLLRAEADFFQSLFDLEVARAYLRKVRGDDVVPGG
ncbi:MAG: TolC family protein [Syntrophorhabdaceae bacterium]|nr:TolC family protein [Syntrophorhabdaceae bacterium]